LNKREFKKTIQSLPHDELCGLLLDLFSTSKVFRDTISSRISPSDADDVLEKYRGRLEKEVNRIQSFSLSSCKSVLTEYESMAPDEKHKAEINFWFAFYAAEFSRTYGDIDSPFYNSLVKAALKAINYASTDREFFEYWSDRFDDLISTCGYFGWGVQEELRRTYTDVELKWFDEDEGDGDQMGAEYGGEERDGS